MGPQSYTPDFKWNCVAGQAASSFDEVSGAGGWIAKRLIWPKVFAFVERSRVEQRKVELLNIGLPSTVAILVTFPIS
ncbi:hypothetical protein N9X05_14180 [Paracoccaceae bacterium]|nr:hypothetical protein [Paracoccaceae bacterium]